ncbi:MAG: hypothetical protein KDB38_10720 [Nocardioidaceae bacterium]|nr:hypothetical protein [Nocardioidaceae bacterium]
MSNHQDVGGSPRRPHHRPLLPGSDLFNEIEGGTDPALVSEAADRAAELLVRGAKTSDCLLRDRVINLVESEGIETLSQLWSGSAADSLAGTLWRLFLLRTWVHADPEGAAREFNEGRHHTPVAEVVTGVTVPPGPDELRRLVDDVLAGLVQGDLADTIFRAAAFVRVAAAGRAQIPPPAGGSSYLSDLSAARLLGLAQQLEHAGHLELRGQLC